MLEKQQLRSSAVGEEENPQRGSVPGLVLTDYLEDAFGLVRMLLGHAPLDQHLPQGQTLLWNETDGTLKRELG